jgi:hypothetical protein
MLPRSVNKLIRRYKETPNAPILLIFILPDYQKKYSPFCKICIKNAVSFLKNIRFNRREAVPSARLPETAAWQPVALQV